MDDDTSQSSVIGLYQAPQCAAYSVLLVDKIQLLLKKNVSRLLHQIVVAGDQENM